MQAILNHPAHWLGSSLFECEDWSWRFEEDHGDEVARALEASAHLPLENITAQTFPLPGLGKKLTAIQNSLETGTGAAFLRGFPLNRFSPEQMKRLFWGMARYIGTPVSQSAKGEFLFSVRNEGHPQGDPKVRGPNTKNRLRFHTDRCDVIGFLCLRQALSGGENFLISSVAVHNEIASRRPDLLKVLYQPFPYLRHTVDKANPRPYCLQPVFAHCQGHFIANVLRVLIDRADAHPEAPNLTQDQKDALDLIDEIAENPSFHARFRQQPGDLLFVNNFLALHSRSAFEDDPRPDHKRHLLRLWLSVPNSRPLPQSFAAHYGATGPGALRGGMNPMKNDS